MIDVYSVENMRNADRNTIENKTPSIELMKRAAHSVLEELDLSKKVYIISGSGNNGGDGIALFKEMIDLGYAPKLYLISNRLSEDSNYFYEQVKYNFNVFNIKDCDYNADIIVDCILGTGFKGDVKDNVKQVIENINKSNAYIVSVDIPSGLNGDNGIARCSIKANKTVAIQFAKYGHYLNDGKDYCGELVIKDIGIDKTVDDVIILEDKDITLPHRLNNVNKGSFGRAVIIGGFKNYYGAIKIANMGLCALRMGAGLNVIACPKSMANIIGASIVESTIYPMQDSDAELVFNKEELDELIKMASSFAIGMGMGNTSENKKIISYILNNFDGPVLLDADGLNSLNGDIDIIKNAKAKVIITPHPKEFSRLTNIDVNRVLENPVSCAQELAKELNAVVLLKGATTIICDKEKKYFMPFGGPSLAKGGSGDTLSGVILGFMSQGMDLIKSCYMGAYLCAKGAKRAEEEYTEYGVLASDVAKEIKHLLG